MKNNAETKLQNAICDFLLLNNWLVLRINSGRIKSKFGWAGWSYTIKNNPITACLPLKTKMVEVNNSQHVGVNDIIAFKNDRYLLLEVKTPTGKLSYSQRLFRRLSESYGCKYNVVRSIDDVEKLIGG